MALARKITPTGIKTHPLVPPPNEFVRPNVVLLIRAHFAAGGSQSLSWLRANLEPSITREEVNAALTRRVLRHKQGPRRESDPPWSGEDLRRRKDGDGIGWLY